MKKKEVVLKFELPGFESKDIKINIAKNAALIKAKKRIERKVQKKDYVHQEKSYRSFSYSTTLPPVNPKKVKIEFKKGKLKIVVPKSHAS